MPEIEYKTLELSTNLRTDLCWRSGLANHGEYRIEGLRFDPATGDNEWEEGLSC